MQAVKPAKKIAIVRNLSGRRARVARVLEEVRGAGLAPVQTNIDMTPYMPVAIYLGVATVAALAFCILPGLLAQPHPNPVKSEAYECGVEPTSEVGGRFPIRFYVIAMLFVIFDVEATSFYPWAVEMHSLRAFGLWEMLAFVITLAIGYAFVWKKGALQWR